MKRFALAFIAAVVLAVAPAGAMNPHSPVFIDTDAATGITVHQENGGRLEDAQELAGHADARTTRLYIRKARKMAQAEVERVQL